MIKNEKQYGATKKHVDDFKKILTDLEAENKKEQTPIRSLQINAIKSQVEELEGEITEYESLKNGSHTVVIISSLDELYKVLIKGRIASKLTQKELAEKLEIKEQQIQRWEASNYETVDLETVQNICDLLNIKISFDKITLSNKTFERPLGLQDVNLDDVQNEIRCRGSLFQMVL